MIRNGLVINLNIYSFVKVSSACAVLHYRHLAEQSMAMVPMAAKIAIIFPLSLFHSPKITAAGTLPFFTSCRIYQPLVFFDGEKCQSL